MLKLNEYIKNENLLVDHLSNGVVEIRHHNTLPLSIYCYGKRATFESIWDDVTCKTRGLIVHDETLEIVARPFEKFFNINTSFRPETSIEALSKEPFLPYIQDKLDGSMGILWQWNGHEGIATKGSFHSEQAEWATQWYKEHRCLRAARNQINCWMYPWTPVFEIICQKIQHHVCHYEPHEDNKLKLIGMVNRQSGGELLGKVLEHQAIINGMECAFSFPFYWKIEDNARMIDSLTKDRRPNREGLVVSWARSGAPPLKVKIKSEDFLKLQRIAHNTTPKVVFDYVRNGNYGEINEVLAHASPWLASQVKEWATNYQEAFDRIGSECRYIVSLALLVCTTRKEFAAYFLQPAYHDLSAALFNVLDERDYKKSVWDLVEPLVKSQKFSEVEAEG